MGNKKAKINPDLEPLTKPIESLRLDENNARKHNARGLTVVKKSLREHGQQKPIVAVRLDDGAFKVIAGNGTLMAAQALKWDRLAVVAYDSDDAAKAAAFALVDNRSAELSEWDPERLKVELPKLTAFELGWTEEEVKEIIAGASAGTDATYTAKVISPVYEPRNKRPAVGELFDRTKANLLVEEINKAGLPPDVAAFLRSAAERHTVFDFKRIADFYAHADAKTQRLFEASALVIIDFDQAVELGYVKLTKVLGDFVAEENAARGVVDEGDDA